MLTKASKDSVIDGQQAFFEDLNQVEANVDKKRDQLILEEFKRLGDKIVAENTQLDLRVTALEKQKDDDRLMKLLDDKLDKETFEDFINQLNDDNIVPINAQLEKAKKNFAGIESFLDKLYQSIKAMEKDNNLNDRAASTMEKSES